MMFALTIVLFIETMSDLEKCLKCNTERFKSNGSVPARSFCNLPLDPRLMRLFGTSNLAKLVQEHGKVSHSSVMHDIHDAPVWKDALREMEYFEGTQGGFLSVSAQMELILLVTFDVTTQCGILC